MKCNECTNYFHAEIHPVVKEEDNPVKVDYQVVSGNIKLCTVIKADPVTIAQQQNGVVGECTHFTAEIPF